MFVRADLKIRYGQAAAFAEAFPPLKAAMEQRGWKLVSAYQAVIGDFTSVLHIWEVEDANTVTSALFSALGDASLTAILERIAEVVLEEKIELVVPTPYHP